MTLSKDDIVNFLRDNKELLKARFDVDEIKLFGSYARDEQHDKSDIDMLVKFGSPSFDKLYELKCWLEKELGRECDLIRMRKSIKRKFLDRVEKESVSV